MFNQLIAAVLPYMPKRLVWIFSRKYISGEYLEDAIRESERINAEGCGVTIDILGEYITRLEEAEAYKIQYLEVIEQFSSNKIRGNFSVKPSMFGLLLDKEACFNLIREIVALADKHNSYIRIDMEDSTCTDDELNIYNRLREEYPKRVGLVLQAYMRRTLDDVKNLMNSDIDTSPLNFRLCKGIYIEDKSIAFKGYQEVRDHFMEDLEFMLQNDIFVGIATHDRYLVEQSMHLIKHLNIPKEKYEFQMLFGVNPKLRKSIVEKGYTMRVYLPFGTEWFNYSTRRLKENPNMVWHILKALIVRG
ncbi:MAG: proline dehydrogenase family protein [Prolixibacteraceae bacterium]|jgi:proline dehydrogenase|nr:proline dehydrogenase family protein [Prolixibacteraceae bacterium]